MIWRNMKQVRFVGIKSVIQFNENQDPVITVNIRRVQCKFYKNHVFHRGMFLWKKHLQLLKDFNTENSLALVTNQIFVSLIFDHSPTKLREGNVFNRKGRWGGGPHVTITHDTLDLTVLCSFPWPSPRPRSWPPPDMGHGPQLVTSGDCFVFSRCPRECRTLLSVQNQRQQHRVVRGHAAGLGW